jgi:hypothetical protein
MRIGIGPSLTLLGLIFVAQGHWQASWAIALGLAITAYYWHKPPKVAVAHGKPQRKPLTQSVRHEVWRRDQGRCVECGSRDRLEFDHIIPVVRGGGSTARNIELRCEGCNRRKGARI